MEAPQFSSASAPFALLASPERRRSLDNYTYKAASAGNIGCGGDQFMVEYLLDLPTDDAAAGGGTDCTFDNVTGSSTDSSTVTANDSGNSCRVSAREPSFNGGMSDTGCCGFADGQFSADLCVPYDDMAELEWLSNFVEESFSSDDQQNLHLISGMSASETAADEFHPNHLGGGSSPMFHSDVTVPAKARSKRSRAAPCNWTSRLLMLSSKASSPEDGTITIHAPEPSQPLISPQQAVVAISTGGRKTSRSTPKKKHLADDVAAEGAVTGREARRCLHCETDTTPQWRTGPTGPKTLCNACGVRYKSGRLVPEYRPAASPTFVLTKHSNSHRKVMELRRQKEMTRAEQQQFQQPHQQQHQFLPNGQNDMVFDTESVDGYLIHRHVCPDFRHLI